METEKMREMYDIHTHSSISDGTTTPSDIAAEVRALGLAGFALTDHDTTEGWTEARAAAKLHGIDFLPGIELTTSHRGKSVHLLAYGVDARDESLQEELSFLVRSRHERAREMIRRLRDDFSLDWDSIVDPHDANMLRSFGRPHLADALVTAGYFTDRTEAFETALATHGPYYIPTYSTETSTAVALVRAAGGFPVVAHPAAFRMKAPLSVEAITELRAAGLGGIELNHPENREDWLPKLRRAANHLELVVTGASDYHGLGKPNRLGDYTTSPETLAKIRSEVVTPH